MLAAAASALLVGVGVLAPASAQAFGQVPSATTVGLDLDSDAFPVGHRVAATVSGSVLDGKALHGRWTLTVSGPGGAVVVADEAVNAASLETGTAFDAGDAGDYRATLQFTPSSPLDEQPASAARTFEVRVVGSIVTVTHGALTAGSSGTLTAAIALADTRPAGGTVRFRVDDTDTDADTDGCTPQSTGARTAGCTLRLPALAAGAHVAHLRWEGSDVYAVGVADVPFTVAASAGGAPGAPAKGGGAGGGSATHAATPAPGASASTRIPTAGSTTAPVAAGQPLDPRTAGATSGIPLLPIAIVVVAVLLCAAIVLTVVVVVRRRRPSA
jgi:hypothetical protein